jgi:alanine racemase
MGIVKANAYGHGLVEISKKLQSLNIDYLGVAYIEEAIYLRENGINLPILVLGAIDNTQIPLFLKNDIDLTGSSIEKLEQISKEAKALNVKARVHLKIDTGMGRIGVQWDRKEEFLEKAFSLPNLDIVGIFSHFANSTDDIEYTNEQLRRFNIVLKYVEKRYKRPALIHLANSGAISNNRRDTFFDMVRPGLLMYGYSFNPEIQKFLKPVMSFKTRVSYFKVLEANMSIGYDRTYFTKERTRIVTIPVGYADGFPKHVGYVYINGKRFPVVGRVCMDQAMVDIGNDGIAYVGDDVELWGENISLFEVSKYTDRSIYELMSNVGERVPRIYLK